MAAEVVRPHEVLSDGGLTPIEFTFKGKRFRIHAVLSRWCEAGGWWNRISDGKFHLAAVRRIAGHILELFG